MSLIGDRLKENGIEADKEATRKLYLFCELLRSWNKTHSLTTLKTDEDFARAIIDSVTPVKFLPPFTKALDIGSGAGLPAVALSILLKDREFTLCEPLAKKYAFLQFAKIELNLNNVTVVKKRVEEMGEGAFELITSRAVADSNTLTNLSERLLSQDGHWLFYKGERSSSEILDERVSVFLYDKRHYILIRKHSC